MDKALALVRLTVAKSMNTTHALDRADDRPNFGVNHLFSDRPIVGSHFGDTKICQVKIVVLVKVNVVGLDITMQVILGVDEVQGGPHGRKPVSEACGSPASDLPSSVQGWRSLGTVKK